MKFFATALMLLMLLILLDTSYVSGKMYEWVDKDGKKHCSNVDPDAAISFNESIDSAEYIQAARSKPILQQGFQVETVSDFRDRYKNDIASLSEIISQLQKRLQDMQCSIDDRSNFSVNVPPTNRHELIKQAEKVR